MLKRDLSECQWTVSPVGDVSQVPAGALRSISASVPGCIHLDLIRAGVLRHPREGFAELDQFWVGRTDWKYECAFEASEWLFGHERLDLVCDGLDTIATIELNGTKVGSAANMFHPHRFNAKDVLRQGENRLAITFKSPLRHIREEEMRLGARPVNGDWDPYIFIRKAACNFGWDWAPKVPTCGVWKGIRLEAWSGVRIAGVRPQVRRIRGDVWRVSVEADLEWAERVPSGLLLGVSLEQNGLDAWASTVPERGKPTTTISFDVENPRVWWPRGHGEQPLYYLKLSLYADGEVDGVADGWVGDIGFREARLHTEPDEHGSRFEIHINGKSIFCKGANWVPDTLFPTECTRERYRERVQQAADANMNMLRVWGGGFYEDEEFYRACDELGIMVWQDFMFACAMYPEEAPYPTLIEAEARHQITRLSSHASVVLWCGGNECVWAYESWGNAPGEKPWKERLAGKTWGAGYYFDLLPRLMEELDPTRPYWANSPWSGSQDITTNGETHGDRHTWDVRMEGYRKIVPRFCSEFGHQAPPRNCGFPDFIDPDVDNIPAHSVQHLAHIQRATGGSERHIDEMLRRWFPKPEDLIQWSAFAQEMQAQALKLGIEWMRALQPRCTGALIWQFNDIWHGFSWSLVEPDGRPRAAWKAVQRAFRPRLLTIQPIEGRHKVIAVNDTDEPWQERLRIMHRNMSHTVVGEVSYQDISIPPRSALIVSDVEQAIGAPRDARHEYIDARTATDRIRAYYVTFKDLDFGDFWDRYQQEP